MTFRFGPPGLKCPLLEVRVAERGMALKTSYTKQEVAKLLQCAERTLLDWRTKGLKPHNLPGGPRYFAEDLEKFLADSKEASDPPEAET